MNKNITYCTKCGSTLLEEDKFCDSCGSEVRQRPSAHKHPDPAQTAEEHPDVSVKDKDDNARALRGETEEEKGREPPVTATRWNGRAWVEVSEEERNVGEPPVTAHAKIKNIGITRLPYWVLSCIGAVICWFMALSILGKDYYSRDEYQFLLDLFPIIMISSVIQMALAYFRLKNTGLNPLLSLLIPIPIVNLCVIWLAACCQEDYADTRELDNAGYALTYVMLFSLIVGAFVQIQLGQ